MKVPEWAWQLGIALSVLSALLLVLSAVAVPRVITGLPADVLVSDAPSERSFAWWCRNALGGLLVLAGVAMLVLPGQGLICIGAGLLWMDVPGKQRLAVRLLRRDSLANLVNGLRERRGVPPLQMPAE